MQGLITIKSIGDKDMKKTIVSTNRLMILAMMMVMTISANATASGGIAVTQTSAMS